jgi:hypothetical protein
MYTPPAPIARAGGLINNGGLRGGMNLQVSGAAGQVANLYVPCIDSRIHSCIYCS